MLKRFVKNGPSASAWHQGTITAAPMVVVIIGAIILFGPETGSLAVFGSLVSMWNSGGSVAARARRYLLVAPLFPLFMALGVVASSWGWVAVVLQSLVILIVTSAYHWWMKGPGPGPLHLFYACSIGVYMGEIGQGKVAVLVTVGATFATASLTFFDLVFRVLGVKVFECSHNEKASIARTDSEVGPNAAMTGFRCGAAGLVSGLFAEFFHLGHSYWAVLSATIVLHGGLGASSTLKRARHRMVGTLFGMLLVGIVGLTHPCFGVQIAIVVLAVWGMNVVMAWHYAIAAIFITAMTLQVNILILGGMATTGLIRDRLVATVLGVLVALAVLGLSATRRR